MHQKTGLFGWKGYHLAVLQAQTTSAKFLMYVCVGWPCSVQDVRVLINVSLYSKCDSGSSPRNWPKVINGTSIPLFIFGDPAYPLTSWLIKPFQIVTS